MSDLDAMLRTDISSLAADAAEVPDFQAIRHRGATRRRRQAVIGTAVAAALVVAVSLAAGRVVGHRSTAPVGPATPTPTVTTDRSAESVVDDPDNGMVSLAVSPDDPEVRAVGWTSCDDVDCTTSSEALAVTDDGFKTRTVFALRHPIPTYVGHDTFAIGAFRSVPVLVHADGTLLDVQLSGVTGPIAGNEVLVDFGTDIAQWAGVDPETGRGHLTTVPQGLTWRVTSGDQVYGLADRDFVSSGDGGATWSRTSLGANASSSLRPAAWPAGGPIAVVEVDNRTYGFALEFAHRSSDDGRTFERIRLFANYNATAAGEPIGVLSDGRLVVRVDAWSDTRSGRASKRPIGLYVSNDDDWSEMTPLQLPPTVGSYYQAFEAIPRAAGSGILATESALAGDQPDLVSYDGGETWTPFALR